MASVHENEGLSLDDIIQMNKKKKTTTENRKGPVRGGARQREAPYPSKRGGNWEHDKFDEASRKQRPAKPAAEPKPQMTEAERGYKVTVTNTAFSEEEFKTLLAESEIKFIRVSAPKKTASLFFAKKEDADKAVADFNDTELEDGAGKSTWEYQAWTERPPREPKERREREPRERREREPRGEHRGNNRRDNRDDHRREREIASSGSQARKINPKDVVISVKY